MQDAVLAAKESLLDLTQNRSLQAGAADPHRIGLGLSRQV